MTEQSNAELIAEAQEASASEHEELGEDAYVGGLLDRLAAALKAAEQRAAEEERQRRLSQQAWAETLSDRNQYAAVVEKVRGVLSHQNRLDEYGVEPLRWAVRKANGILATAPADALRERDAEKWDEGVNAEARAAVTASPRIKNPYREEADRG